MTDIVAALAAIRARAEGQITTLPLKWQDETNELPDEPEPFAFVEVITDRSGFIEIGGGRGANRHRQTGEIHAYVFAPIGRGLAYGAGLAEPVAAVFRSYRGGGISCMGASVHPVGEGSALVPPGLSSAAGNYACVVVIVPFYFDQTA